MTMASLVEELQRDALDPNVSVADLLRKASAVASKLSLDTFAKWCKSERDGYRNGDVPAYRNCGGTLRAFNPYRGWIPVVFHDARFERLCSSYSETSAVGILDDLLRGDNEGTYQRKVPPEVSHELMKDDPDPMELRLHVSRAQVVKILDAVRNIILDWSLQLERDGILGDGMSFKPGEKRIAIDHAQSLQAPVYFILNNSSIQSASPGATQEIKQ
jgi:hypothetical protein